MQDDACRKKQEGRHPVHANDFLLLDLVLGPELLVLGVKENGLEDVVFERQIFGQLVLEVVACRRESS